MGVKGGTEGLVEAGGGRVWGGWTDDQDVWADQAANPQSKQPSERAIKQADRVDLHIRETETVRVVGSQLCLGEGRIGEHARSPAPPVVQSITDPTDPRPLTQTTANKHTRAHTAGSRRSESD